MAVTDADFEGLKTRVGRLEKASIENTETIGWLAGTLGGMKAVQDNHTQRLERLEGKVDRLESKVDLIDRSLNNLAATLPSLVADAMREVLKENR